MNLFGMLEMSGSALGAERMRAEIVTANMANAQVTHTEEGGPYRRKMVVFAERRVPHFSLALAGAAGTAAEGVRVTQIVTSNAAPLQRYEPGHPDADARGFVAYPNIDPMEEMTDLLGASRAYELNASAIQTAKAMIQQSLDLLR